MYGMSAAPIELILSSMLPGKTYDSIIKLMIHKFNTFLQELEIFLTLHPVPVT